MILGLAGLTASTMGVVAQVMPRSFSQSQQRQLAAWEIGKRWRTWAAGTIFPAAVSYRVSGGTFGWDGDLTLVAHRIGIAPQARCKAATDSRAARILEQHGCLAVIRATFDDSTQSLAVTVGVAVLPSEAAARASARALPAGDAARLSLRAVPFPHTVAARFGDAQRQLAWRQRVGPYLVFATVGYADGRRLLRKSANPYAKAEMLGLARGIGGWVASHLGAAPPPARCPGGPAC